MYLVYFSKISKLLYLQVLVYYNQHPRPPKLQKNYLILVAKPLLLLSFIEALKDTIQRKSFFNLGGFITWSDKKKWGGRGQEKYTSPSLLCQ